MLQTGRQSFIIVFRSCLSTVYETVRGIDIKSELKKRLNNLSMTHSSEFFISKWRAVSIWRDYADSSQRGSNPGLPIVILVTNVMKQLKKVCVIPGVMSTSSYLLIIQKSKESWRGFWNCPHFSMFNHNVYLGVFTGKLLIIRICIMSHK